MIIHTQDKPEPIIIHTADTTTHIDIGIGSPAKGILVEQLPSTQPISISVTRPDGMYQGDYTVTPKAETPTVLETKGLVMASDVTVVKIPKYVVSNLAGGDTVYIGGDADYGQV